MKRTVLIVVLITLCQTPIHFAQNPKRLNSQDGVANANGQPTPEGRLKEQRGGTSNPRTGAEDQVNAAQQDQTVNGNLTVRGRLDVTTPDGQSGYKIDPISGALSPVGAVPLPGSQPFLIIDGGNTAETTLQVKGGFEVLPEGEEIPTFVVGNRGKLIQVNGGLCTQDGTPFRNDNTHVVSKRTRSQTKQLAQPALPSVLFYALDDTGDTTAGLFSSVSGMRPSIYGEKTPPQSGKLSASDDMAEHVETLNQASANAQNDLPAELSQFLQQQQSLPTIWGVSAMPATEAILGQNALTTSTSAAVRGVHQGLGVGVNGQIANASSTAPAVWGLSNGTGSGVAATMTGNGTSLLVDHNGMMGNLAVFRSNNANQIRFTKAGRGHFNGGTQNGGADVAEAFEVEGSVHAYEPGDVLVISTSTDRTVEKSREPYSTLVAGVYATKSGVLLTERNVDDSHEDTVPLGIVGVIPTKVSAENGPIRRGDLLVTSSIAGHAMKGTDQSRMLGAVIGKALENFDGEGSGVIRVLVNVK
jgi:hypothetical protein